MEGLLRFNEWLSGVVWGWPMLLLLTLAGVVFTVRTRFVQLRRFGDMLRLTLGAFTRRKNTAPGEVSPLQAMTTALAATVGTGNIAGVAGAIALGGPGAVFWMWVSAFLGMATKYAEVVLAVRYRQRAADGSFLRRADVLYPRSGQGLCPARAHLCPARGAGRLWHRQHGAGQHRRGGGRVFPHGAFPRPPGERRCACSWGFCFLWRSRWR